MSLLRNFFLPVGLLVGSIIGAGIFSLPFVFSRSGISVGIFYLVVGGLAYTIIHLMYADVIMRTKEEHRFPGYAKAYLGGFAFVLAALTGVLEMLLVMTIYLILSERFAELMFPTTGGMSEVLVFWLLGSFAIFVNLRRITAVEGIVVVGILAIVGILFSLGISHVSAIAAGSWMPHLSFLLFPLAPVLFALNGRVAIPPLVRYVSETRTGTKERIVRRAIIGGTLIPVVVYFLFVVGILGLSPHVSEDAVSGLLGFVSPSLLALIGVLGLFTLWSSYISVGFDVHSILSYDFKISRGVRFFIVIALPLILYLAGLRNFLALVGFVGGIFVALEGFIIILMWWRANHVLKTSSTLMRGVHPLYILLTVLMFGAAFVYQIFGS